MVEFKRPPETSPAPQGSDPPEDWLAGLLDDEFTIAVIAAVLAWNAVVRLLRRYGPGERARHYRSDGGSGYSESGSDGGGGGGD